MGFDRETPRGKIWYWRFQGFVLCLVVEFLLWLALKAYAFYLALVALGRSG